MAIRINNSDVWNKTSRGYLIQLMNYELSMIEMDRCEELLSVIDNYFNRMVNGSSKCVVVYQGMIVNVEPIFTYSFVDVNQQNKFESTHSLFLAEEYDLDIDKITITNIGFPQDLMDNLDHLINFQ